MQAVTELRIDWFQVITSLGRAGYSLSAVASAIRVPKGTLTGWKQGAEPRYSDGERLVQLWCQITGRDRTDLPTCRTADWWAYHSK